MPEVMHSEGGRLEVSLRELRLSKRPALEHREDEVVGCVRPVDQVGADLLAEEPRQPHRGRKCISRRMLRGSRTPLAGLREYGHVTAGLRRCIVRPGGRRDPGKTSRVENPDKEGA
jgi:hypothetical protein